jgi:hypothetical protein
MATWVGRMWKTVDGYFNEMLSCQISKDESEPCDDALLLGNVCHGRLTLNRVGASLVSSSACARAGCRLLMVLFASMFTGCASLTPEDSEAWRDSQQRALVERAELRWKALISGDFEKAYQYQSPAYRAVVSMQQFKASFGGSVAWLAARAGKVEYDEPSAANVTIGVEYSAGIFGGGNYKSTRELMERWLYVDGTWWYVSVK